MIASQKEVYKGTYFMKFVKTGVMLPSSKYMYNVSKNCIKYATSLQDQIENLVISDGFDSVVIQLIARNNNLNRKYTSFYLHRKCSKEESADLNLSTVRRKQSTSIGSYGCIN